MKGSVQDYFRSRSITQLPPTEYNFRPRSTTSVNICFTTIPHSLLLARMSQKIVKLNESTWEFQSTKKMAYLLQHKGRNSSMNGITSKGRRFDGEEVFKGLLFTKKPIWFLFTLCTSVNFLTTVLTSKKTSTLLSVFPPTSFKKSKRLINERVTCCNSLLSYEGTRQELEHVIRNRIGNEMWSIYNDKYFEIWTFDKVSFINIKI